MNATAQSLDNSGSSLLASIRAGQRELAKIDAEISAKDEQRANLAAAVERLSQPTARLAAHRAKLHSLLSAEFAGGAAADTKDLEAAIAQQQLDVAANAPRLDAAKVANDQLTGELNVLHNKMASKARDLDMPTRVWNLSVERSIAAGAKFEDKIAEFMKAYAEFAAHVKRNDLLKPISASPTAVNIERSLAFPTAINMKALEQIGRPRDPSADIATRTQELCRELNVELQGS